ncbi:MAG TPA: hypothetical protein PLV91_03940, partial [Verrucomicrobiota bacterium]|nr:hypothetical protein [Verrucomicrobiota bacterium]
KKERPNIVLETIQVWMRPLRGRNDVGGDRVPGGVDPGDTFNPHFSTTLEGSHPVIPLKTSAGVCAICG